MAKSPRTVILIVALLLVGIVFTLMIRFSSIDHDNLHQPAVTHQTQKKQQHEVPRITTTSNDDDDHQKNISPSSSSSSSSLQEETVIRTDDDLLLKSNLPSLPTKNDKILFADSSSSSSSSCQVFKNCLTCLFRSSSDCVWLASREKCVDASFAKNNLPGVDLEDVACPAILHSSSSSEKSHLVPATFNVIHVAIRKGGPEALIQLHLALVYWGFNTNLDSRKSKKQKGGPVVPFFKEMYAKEFSRVNNVQQQFRSHFQDYDHWQRSGKEGDMLIATETWKCRNDRIASPGLASLFSEPTELRTNGVRYAQWHLTVWPRKPRSGCTIMVHTKYIGEVFMRAPLLSLLFPYVSPHIVRLADKMKKEVTDFEIKKKQENNFNLLMFDGDMKMNPEVFNTNNNRKNKFIVKKAAGFTPQQLYEEYSKASVCLDWELPGGERFIYEGALFGCCSIVDRSLNGLDKEDFPLPDALRVTPSSKPADLASPLQVPSTDYILGTKKQQKHRDERENSRDVKSNSMHDAIALCTNPETRSETMKSLEPLRLSILKQRVRFHRHVRRYFSNNIHIVTAVATVEEFKKFVGQFIVTTLIAVPLATIEIVLSKELAANKEILDEMKNEQLTLLLDHSYLAAVLWTVDQSSINNKEDDFFAHVVENSPSIITTSSSRVGFVAFVRVESIIANRYFVHYLASITSMKKALIRNKEKDNASSFSGIKTESFVFLNDVSMFSASKNSERTNQKVEVETILKLDAVAEEVVVLKQKRIGEGKLLWKNVKQGDDDNKWKEFLCEHAIYEMMFAARC